jgi:hypothetical protein
MYPSKPIASNNASLHTHWHTGVAEYLPGDYGVGLATFVDEDFAWFLLTRWSVSANCHLLNGVLVSWGCKKQPTTSLHSRSVELTTLHCAAFKSSILQTFLSSIGVNLFAIMLLIWHGSMKAFSMVSSWQPILRMV